MLWAQGRAHYPAFARILALCILTLGRFWDGDIVFWSFLAGLDSYFVFVLIVVSLFLVLIHFIFMSGYD